MLHSKKPNELRKIFAKFFLQPEHTLYNCRQLLYCNIFQIIYKYSNVMYEKYEKPMHEKFVLFLSGSGRDKW